MEVPLPIPSCMRYHLLEFFIYSSQQLRIPHIVKYTALSFLADRFLPNLPSFLNRSSAPNWLLNPLRESNLQLFSLVSVWISSKIHDSRPLSVKSLKSLGDKLIVDQHFTTRDFAEAELVFMEVLRFDIGTSEIAFRFLEDLLIQLSELSRMGIFVNIHLCTEIMDLLYQAEETAMLFTSPCAVAASILAAAYVLSVPQQQWEFPVLPWVKFTTLYEETYIGEITENILEHILNPETPIQSIVRATSP